MAHASDSSTQEAKTGGAEGRGQCERHTETRKQRRKNKYIVYWKMYFHAIDFDHAFPPPIPPRFPPTPNLSTHSTWYSLPLFLFVK